MSTHTVKISEQKIEIKDSKDTEYQIRTDKGGKIEIEFEKKEKDKSESKEEVKFEYRKKEKEKDWGEWKPFSSKVKWTGGWAFNGMKIVKKELESGVEMKEELALPTGFFGTPTIVSWIGIGIIIIGIIALIWWWVASSNKEDKEEESL